jgi:3-deoxy-7-phosphoheptulonate synthase/chorismate mutase
MERLEVLREEINRLNRVILKALNKRAEVVKKIAAFKQEQGLDIFDPVRESKMLQNILKQNSGPFSNEVIAKLFKEIFSASLHFMGEEVKKRLLVTRKSRSEDTVIQLQDFIIGGGKPVIMAGPCSVESFEQMEKITAFLVQQGVRIIRGGAYKPRTSPYSFQGLREEGLKILKAIKAKYPVFVISEVMDTRDVERMAEVVDILQIGARNMYNYELLKEIGRLRHPVLLKRSFSATLEEFLLSAEYIMTEGNAQIILCERGIRTFERWTRNTLDISAVPILKMESHLPVIVDISHATGRRDIANPMAKACLAAGADGLMLELHYEPAVALSDGDQQLDFPGFLSLLEAVKQ